MLEVPGRFLQHENQCWGEGVGRGRLLTEEGTVLEHVEKPRILTTRTTVLQGPMMLLITGAKVLEWPGGSFLFCFSV